MPECVPAGQKRLPGVCGARQNVPGVQPGGARKENREAERFGKAGRLNGAGLTPPIMGRSGLRPPAGSSPARPARGLRAYEEAAVRRMRNKDKIKSISADSGVGSKGVKADPRRTAMAARSILTYRRPAASGQADRSHKRQVQRDVNAAPPLEVHDQRVLYGLKSPATCCSHPFSDSSRYRCPMAGGG